MIKIFIFILKPISISYFNKYSIIFNHKNVYIYINVYIYTIYKTFIHTQLTFLVNAWVQYKIRRCSGRCIHCLQEFKPDEHLVLIILSVDVIIDYHMYYNTNCKLYMIFISSEGDVKY